MQKRFQVVKARGYTFILKYDAAAPDILHIFARHLTGIPDVLDVFFNHTSKMWNEDHDRFETFTKTHGLYWFWRDEKKKVVVVITCFTI